MNLNPALFKQYATLNIQAILSIIRIETKVFFQTRPMLISQILTPLMYFLFIIAALADMIGDVTINGTTVPYNEYALVGILIMSMMGQMSRVIYRMTVDRRYGFFALKMQAGVKPFFYILSMSTSAILGYATQGLVFYFIILIFHLHFNILMFLSMWAIGLISLFFWISLGTGITMFIKTYQVRDMVLTFLIMPLSFSAPSFYVLQSAPKFVQIIATINPLTYQLEAMRQAAFGIIHPLSIIYVTLFSIISLFIASLIVHHTELITNEQTYAPFCI